MKRLVYALLLLVAPSLLGAPFTLTNTRYGEAPAMTATLATNGRDAFVLWKSRTTVNITRIVAGEFRAGRPVFPAFSAEPDIVWTGHSFLAVASSGGNIIGRVLDANGEPVGGVFTIAEGGHRPRLASNGTNALLVHARGASVLATLLTATGVPVNGGSIGLATHAYYDVASNGIGFAAITASPGEVRVTTIAPGGAAGAKATVSTFELQPQEERAVAIASDGSGYLAVWNTRSLFDAVPVNAGGTAGVPFNIGVFADGEAVGAAAVAWTGSEYATAFIGGPRGAERLFVARTSTHSLRSVSEGRPASRGAAVSLLQAGGRTLMTWQNAPDEPLLIADPSDPDAVPVTFAAAHQELGAAVSSRTATLVAWTEVIGNTRSLRAGVRGADGSWVERRIGGDEQAIRASADDTNFLLITRTAEGWSALRLDAQANVLSRTPRLPLLGELPDVTVAWNGLDYAVAYVDGQGQPAVVRVSRNGVVSPPRTFPVHDYAARASVTTNGTNFLFTWNDIESTFCFPVCDFERDRVLAVRVRPDFTVVDPEPLVLAENDARLIGSGVRDGAYEVFWTTPEGLTVHRVPASGALDPERKIDLPETRDLVWRWHDLQVVSHGEEWRAVWPRQGGSEPTRYFDWRTFPAIIPTPFHERDLIAMPDGRYGWVGVDVQEAAPHHGAQRVTIDIPSSETAVPDAPLATVSYDGREMTIEWTAPAQPVDGYRVEYRIGNGSWNEFPRQYGAHERTATWTSIVRGKSYAFRVRAFAGNGPGAYSEPVAVGTAGKKRRAVR